MSRCGASSNDASWTPIELCFLLVAMAGIWLDQHPPAAVKPQLPQGLCPIIWAFKGKKPEKVFSAWPLKGPCKICNTSAWLHLNFMYIYFFLFYLLLVFKHKVKTHIVYTATYAQMLIFYGFDIWKLYISSLFAVLYLFLFNTDHYMESSLFAASAPPSGHRRLNFNYTSCREMF